MYAGRVTQITKLEGAGLKIEVIPRQHSIYVCVCVCLSVLLPDC